MPPVSIPTGYELFDQVPDPTTYVSLRKTAGLSDISLEAAEVGLRGQWAGVLVRQATTKTVGMGRVIGDGACFFQIVDMAVLPEHQRKGLGAAILDRLLWRLRTEVPEGANVSLLADPPARALYQRFGFEFSAPHSVGMKLRIS